MPNSNTFCLFEGRHVLPNNQGAVCADFDFQKFKAVRTPNWEKFVRQGGKLYVTGLTPALTELLSECAEEKQLPFPPRYELMHFDLQSKQYVSQLW